MKISDCRIGFLGFGHMAQVILRALLAAKASSSSQIMFTQKNPLKMKENEKRYRVRAESLKNLVTFSDIIVLGVRPHQVEEVLDEIKSFCLSEKKILISVAAGILFKTLKKDFPGDVVRAMPNIASSVGEGMTTLSFLEGASEELKSLARSFFLSMGKVLEVSEPLMHLTTAISGSGPGFVFELIKAVSIFGQKHGLKKEEALFLASQTFLGASQLIAQGALPEKLLYEIATPNGVTEAGLKKMEELEISSHLQEVLEAAMKRSLSLQKKS